MKQDYLLKLSKKDKWKKKFCVLVENGIYVFLDRADFESRKVQYFFQIRLGNFEYKYEEEASLFGVKEYIALNRGSKKRAICLAPADSGVDLKNWVELMW